MFSSVDPGRLMAAALTVFEVGFLVFYAITTTAFIRGFWRGRDRTALAMGLMTAVRILATLWMVGLYLYAYRHPDLELTRLLIFKLPIDLLMAGAITFFMWPQVEVFFGWQNDKRD